MTISTNVLINLLSNYSISKDVDLCIVKIENETMDKYHWAKCFAYNGDSYSILTYKGQRTCYQVTGVILL